MTLVNQNYDVDQIMCDRFTYHLSQPWYFGETARYHISLRCNKFIALRFSSNPSNEHTEILDGGYTIDEAMLVCKEDDEARKSRLNKEL